MTYQGASLAVGTQASADALTLSGTVLTSHTGAIANTAMVTPRITPEPTVNPLPNESTATVTPAAEATLGVTKERVVSDGAGGWRAVTAADVFVAGTDISYRMTAVNNGPADARNVRVVDEVPTGLSFSAKVDISGSWTPTDGGTTSTGGPTPTWDTFTLAGTIPATTPATSRRRRRSAPRWTRGSPPLRDASGTALRQARRRRGPPPAARRTAAAPDRW